MPVAHADKAGYDKGLPQEYERDLIDIVFAEPKAPTIKGVCWCRPEAMAGIQHGETSMRPRIAQRWARRSVKLGGHRGILKKPTPPRRRDRTDVGLDLERSERYFGRSAALIRRGRVRPQSYLAERSCAACFCGVHVDAPDIAGLAGSTPNCPAVDRDGVAHCFLPTTGLFVGNSAERHQLASGASRA